MKRVLDFVKALLTKLLLLPIYFYKGAISPLTPPLVPLYALLLNLCHRGTAQVWAIQGALPRCASYPALSPLGW